MKKFRVQFWLDNGNHYSWFVKALDYDEAVSIVYEKYLSEYEPIAQINEICINCAN